MAAQDPRNSTGLKSLNLTNLFLTITVNGKQFTGLIVVGARISIIASHEWPKQWEKDLPSWLLVEWEAPTFQYKAKGPSRVWPEG